MPIAAFKLREINIVTQLHASAHTAEGLTKIVDGTVTAAPVCSIWQPVFISSTDVLYAVWSSFETYCVDGYSSPQTM